MVRRTDLFNNSGPSFVVRAGLSSSRDPVVFFESMLISMSEAPTSIAPVAPAVADPFRFMADNAPDAYFLVDAAGRIAYANRVAHLERGYEPGELVGKSATLVSPTYPSDRVSSLFDAARSGNTFRLRHVHRRRDGSEFPVESSVNFLEIEGQPYLFSAVRDVTAQLRVDADSRRRREQMQMVVRQANVGIFTCDYPLAEMGWDEKTREHFFLTPDEHVTIETFYARLHPEDRDATRAALDASLANRTLYDVNYRTVDPASGAVRWINAIGRWHYDADGTPTHLDGITADITRQVDAAAALRESERRFRQMADGAPVAIWVTEPDGRCSFLSQRWYAYTGQTEAEAMGLGWIDATHPDDADRVRDVFLAANAARGPFQIEYRLRGSDGGYRWFIDSALPRFDDVGHFLGYVGSVKDIHDRRLAEERVRESEQRLQLALAIAGLGTFDIDIASGAVFVNDAGRAIYGWEPDVVATYAMIRAARHPDDDAHAVATIDAAGRPGGSPRYELEQRIRRADGQQRWVRVRGLALFDAGPGRPATRLIGTFLDVTDQRDAADRRERLLEAERLARVEAERASRIKDEFLTTLSHELRTPLNSILGWAHLLRRGDKSNDPTLAQGLDTIQRNARAQAQLIEDLLDVRALVGGTIRLRTRGPVDLAATLREAAESVAPAVLAKSIRLEIDAGPGIAIVAGDGDRLRQIFWNLLNNAAKFTPKDGTVRATIVTADDEQVRVVVSDSGQGIDAEFLPHVFDRFSMADASSTRRHGGLGLGLALVKALVELHGGTVRAESAGQGLGATFTVSLPAT